MVLTGHKYAVTVETFISNMLYRCRGSNNDWLLLLATPCDGSNFDLAISEHKIMVWPFWFLRVCMLAGSKIMGKYKLSQT